MAHLAISFFKACCKYTVDQFVDTRELLLDMHSSLELFPKLTPIKDITMKSGGLDRG